MKKLRICLISLKVYPDGSDGEAVVIRGYYDYLKKRGHKVKLLTGKWTKELSDPDIIQFDIINKKFLWIPHFIIKVFKYLLEHDFDIVHGNGPKGTFPIILINKKRIISTIHDLGPFETHSSRISLEKYLIKFVATKASYLTTVSNMVKREFKYYFPQIKNEKIQVIYNGVTDNFRPYPKKAKQLKHSLGIKGPILIYIGRIAPNKGVEYIIKAFRIAKKTFSDLNLIIGGKPDFSMKLKYERWKNQYNDILFTGLIPEEKLPIYYSMADIFITYSHSSEGFGLTSIEAIACGTPVICSSLLVYKEILQNNAIFVPPKNPKLLSQKILTLLKNEEKRDQLIKKAQDFIKRYKWDNVGENLEKFYYTLLKSNGI